MEQRNTDDTKADESVNAPAAAAVDAISAIPYLNDYLKNAVERCETEQLDDGSWYVSIPGFDGVWAGGVTRELAIEELRSVLLDWLELKRQDRDGDIPVVAHIDINPR